MLDPGPNLVPAPLRQKVAVAVPAPVPQHWKYVRNFSRFAFFMLSITNNFAGNLLMFKVTMSMIYVFTIRYYALSIFI
jgi:hypothetical protein